MANSRHGKRCGPCGPGRCSSVRRSGRIAAPGRRSARPLVRRSDRQPTVWARRQLLGAVQSIAGGQREGGYYEQHAQGGVGAVHAVALRFFASFVSMCPVGLVGVP